MEDVPFAVEGFHRHEKPLPIGRFRVDAIHHAGVAGYRTLKSDAVTFPVGWGANRTLPNSPSMEDGMTVVVDFAGENTKGNVPLLKRRMFVCSTRVVKPTSVEVTVDPTTSMPEVVPMMCPLNQEGGQYQWSTTERGSCFT